MKRIRRVWLTAKSGLLIFLSFASHIITSFGGSGDRARIFGSKTDSDFEPLLYLGPASPYTSLSRKRLVRTLKTPGDPRQDTRRTELISGNDSKINTRDERRSVFAAKRALHLYEIRFTHWPWNALRATAKRSDVPDIVTKSFFIPSTWSRRHATVLAVAYAEKSYFTAGVWHKKKKRGRKKANNKWSRFGRPDEHVSIQDRRIAQVNGEKRPWSHKRATASAPRPCMLCRDELLTAAFVQDRP